MSKKKGQAAPQPEKEAEEEQATGQEEEPEKAMPDAADDDEKTEDGPHDQLVELLQLRGKGPGNDTLQDVIDRGVQSLMDAHDVTTEYNVLVLFDTGAMVRADADRVYTALGRCEQDKPLLLVLQSNGGDVAAAYFIGKLCRERTPDRFVVAVPRRAKSAATLICCAGDEVHMGSLSELGPIDPQFEGVPALALKYSIEHLADLTKEYPAAAEMFSSYLAKALDIQELGYYERVAESATQYAERLLKSRNVEKSPEVGGIAQRLVYSYKDHGFVIDAQEALDIFGDEVVKQNTDEYALANDLYTWLDLYRRVVRDFFGRQMYYVGDMSSGANLYRLSVD